MQSGLAYSSLKQKNAKDVESNLRNNEYMERQSDPSINAMDF